MYKWEYVKKMVEVRQIQTKFYTQRIQGQRKTKVLNEKQLNTYILCRSRTLGYKKYEKSREKVNIQKGPSINVI